MSHPSSIDLEAFACGEDIAAVVAHVDECEACRSFVDRARGLPAPKIDLSVPAPAPPNVVRLPRVFGAIALPLAAAAVLLLFLREKKPADVASPIPSTPPTATTTATATAAKADPTTSFKGVRQVAVIRERDGEQKRFSGRVPVKEGDRLRVEVAIDREQTILAGVLGEDGSYLELMPAATRAAGTHYSDKSARVSGPPSNGTILVGSEADVARARRHLPTSDVDEVRVEWEATR